MEPPQSPGLSDEDRDRFDALLGEVIETLPAPIRGLIDEVPVVVFDRPSPELIESLRKDGTLTESDDGADLCGLHTGVAITDRSVEGLHGAEWGGSGGGGDGDGCGPEHICLFRAGIIELAGGWEQPHADQEVYEEIRITLLHEIGHHFGLDEDDLERLGYA